jgi:hypothetical protein
MRFFIKAILYLHDPLKRGGTEGGNQNGYSSTSTTRYTVVYENEFNSSYYEFKFKFEKGKEGRRRKNVEINASKRENEIPLLNAFHVELNSYAVLKYVHTEHSQMQNPGAQTRM